MEYKKDVHVNLTITNETRQRLSDLKRIYGMSNRSLLRMLIEKEWRIQKSGGLQEVKL